MGKLNDDTIHLVTFETWILVASITNTPQLNSNHSSANANDMLFRFRVISSSTLIICHVSAAFRNRQIYWRLLASSVTRWKENRRENFLSSPLSRRFFLLFEKNLSENFSWEKLPQKTQRKTRGNTQAREREWNIFKDEYYHHKVRLVSRAWCKGLKS